MNSTTSVLIRKRRRGFTLIDALTALAILSSVTAVVVVAMSWSRTAASEVKLKQDVANLNRAVRMYLGSGGTLPTTASATDVIQKLKMKVATKDQKVVAGLTGSMIDGRMKGEAATGSQTRAVWDKTARQFVLKDSGDGFARFVLDESADVAPTATDTRSSTYQYAAKSGWIWDEENAPLVASGPKSGSGTKWITPIDPPEPGGDIMGVLSPPVFSISGGLRDPRDYNPALPLTLTDPNPSGSSVLYYSLNGSTWNIYKAGTVLSLPQSLLTSVRAYTAPIDPERWTDSPTKEQDYETIWFTGGSAGKFHTPVGDAKMVTNLVTALLKLLRLPEFTWGAPALGFSKPNRLTFTGKNFSKIAPEQEFELGTLEYYNGTTNAGTNATQVQIDIELGLTSLGSNEKLNFKWGLESVTNVKGHTDDQNADYVRMGTMSSQLQTMIAGRRYFLNMRFGDHSNDGFTTISTFHTHEDKTMKGTVYGKFSLDPSTGTLLPRDTSNNGNNGNSGTGNNGNSGTGNNGNGNGNGQSLIDIVLGVVNSTVP